MDAEDDSNEQLCPPPKLNPVEERINKVCQDAVRPILRVSVMYSMMAGSLQDAQSMKHGNEWTVLFWAAMRPAMKLVAEGAKQAEQPELPGDAEKDHNQHKNEEAENCRNDVAAPERASDKITRSIVVDDVWSDNKPAENRSLLRPVRILKPMENSREKIDQEDDGDSLHGNQ